MTEAIARLGLPILMILSTSLAPVAARINTKTWCATSKLRDWRVEAVPSVPGADGKLLTRLVGLCSGGSNAIGLFHPFLEDASVWPCTV